MSGDDMSPWEVIYHYFNDDKTVSTNMCKMKVEGGHLYKDYVHSGAAIACTMCFVPDIDLTRYQSHLRDAYTQGFKDGLEENRTKTSNL